MEAPRLRMHAELPAVPMRLCKNLRQELSRISVMFVSGTHVQAAVRGTQIALVHAVLAVDPGLHAENAAKTSYQIHACACAAKCELYRLASRGLGRGGSHCPRACLGQGRDLNRV